MKIVKDLFMTLTGLTLFSRVLFILQYTDTYVFNNVMRSKFYIVQIENWKQGKPKSKQYISFFSYAFFFSLPFNWSTKKKQFFYTSFLSLPTNQKMPNAFLQQSTSNNGKMEK